MSSAAIRAGKAFIEFSAKDKKLQSAMSRIQKQFAAVIQVAKLMSAVVTAAFAAATAAAWNAANVFRKVGDEMAKAAKRLGVGADELSALEFAATRSGASLSDVESGFRRMFAVLNDLRSGTGEAAEAFKELGLSYRDLSRLKPERQFRLIAQRLRQLSAGRRREIIQDIFGRGGLRLLPMIEDDIDKLIARAKELGIVLSQEDAQAAEEFEDAVTDLSRAFRSTRMQVGALVANAITPLLDMFASLIGQFNQWIQQARVGWQAFQQMSSVALNMGITSFSQFVKDIGRMWNQLTVNIANQFDQAMSSVIQSQLDVIKDLIKRMNALKPFLSPIGQTRLGFLQMGMEMALEAGSSPTAVNARSANRQAAADKRQDKFENSVDGFARIIRTAAMGFDMFMAAQRIQRNAAEAEMQGLEDSIGGGSSLPARFSAAAAAIQGGNLRQGEYLASIAESTKKTAQNTKKRHGIPVN